MTFFAFQAPTNNESIPEPLMGKVNPNLIPIYCKNKVSFKCLYQVLLVL